MKHKKETIKVSVIVPVYNLENYVSDCIEGLVRQKTSYDFEVIVVDDASSDNSCVILDNLQKNYPSILRIHKNKVNLGLAKTMQSLLGFSRGEYIAYLDGDDLALPGKLQKQSDYLDAHQGCSIVYHESDVFNSKTNKTLWTYTKNYYNHSYIPQQADVEHVIRYGCFMHASTVMIRRHNKMIDAVSNNNVILHDHSWHVLNLIYGKGSIDFINETLGRYRIHDSSFGAQTLRSSQRREQVLKDQLNACLLASELGVSNDVIQAGIDHYYYATALFFLKSKKDQLFHHYIDKSTNGINFFDEKHQAVFNDRHHPKLLRTLFFKDV